MRMVYDIIEPPRLIAAVRRLSHGQNWLQNVLPNRVTEDIDYRIVEVGRINRAAQIRAFDSPARIGARPGAGERRGTLPPISSMRFVSEYERYRQRRLGGAVGDLLQRWVLDDAALGSLEVANRLELLRGEVLADHQIVIAEGGVNQVIPYNVPSPLRVTAAVPWTDPTADILGDLTTWHETYNDHGNDGAGMLLTSNRVRGLAMRNDAIRQLAATLAGTPSVVTQEAVNQVLQAHGLPPFTTYNRRVEDADGNAFRVIPEDRLIYLPGAPAAGGPDANAAGQAMRLGETQLGLTEEAVTLTESQQITTEDAPGMTALTFREDHPVSVWTLVTAVGLPVLQQTRRILTATVF